MPKKSTRDVDIIDYFVEHNNGPATRQVIADDRDVKTGSLQYQLHPNRVGSLVCRRIVIVDRTEWKGPFYRLNPDPESVIRVMHEYYLPADRVHCNIIPELLTPHRQGSFLRSTYVSPLFPDCGSPYFCGLVLARYLNDFTTTEIREHLRRLRAMGGPGPKHLSGILARLLRYRDAVPHLSDHIPDLPADTKSELESLQGLNGRIHAATQQDIEERFTDVAWVEKMREKWKKGETVLGEIAAAGPHTEPLLKRQSQLVAPILEKWEQKYASLRVWALFEHECVAFMGLPVRSLMINEEAFKKLSDILRLSPSFVTRVSSFVSIFESLAFYEERPTVAVKKLGDAMLLKTLQSSFTIAFARTLNSYLHSDRQHAPDLITEESMKQSGFKDMPAVYEYLWHLSCA